MLSEFEAIERSGTAPRRPATCSKALHFLLRRQFVFAGDARTATVYNIIMDSRFRSVIDDFFDSCGYRVHRDAEAQWAGITALGEDVPLPRMKLDETIVILVLAAHWQDEVNVGAVEDRAIVVTTLNTLFDRYKEMVQGSETERDIAAAGSATSCKKPTQRGLVDVGEFEPDAQDVEVAIRPMIKLISGADALLRIERYRAFAGGRSGRAK